MCLRPFGLYRSACLGILFVSILCMCCSHFSWYCFISFTIFTAPVFSLIHWFFFYLVLLFQEGVLKISSVLLLNVPLFSSVPRLHFRISMLLSYHLLYHLPICSLVGSKCTRINTICFRTMCTFALFRMTPEVTVSVLPFINGSNKHSKDES